MEKRGNILDLWVGRHGGRIKARGWSSGVLLCYLLYLARPSEVRSKAWRETGHVHRVCRVWPQTHPEVAIGCVTSRPDGARHAFWRSSQLRSRVHARRLPFLLFLSPLPPPIFFPTITTLHHLVRMSCKVSLFLLFLD